MDLLNTVQDRKRITKRHFNKRPAGKRPPEQPPRTKHRAGSSPHWLRRRMPKQIRNFLAKKGEEEKTRTMLKIAQPDVKSFYYIAAVFGLLQLASCWPYPSSDVTTDYEDIDFNSKKPWNANLNGWNKRTWQNLQGGWGKRNNGLFQYSEDKRNRRKSQDDSSWQKNSEQNDSNFSFEDGVTNDTPLNKDNYDGYIDQNNDEYVIKEKRGWNRLPTWGKRTKWSNIGGSWGKKDPAWTNLKGIWGKRNSIFPDDTNI